jgi:methylamine utilization protein MauE
VVDGLAAIQQVLLGGVLVWASGFKLVWRNAPAAARRSALKRLVGAERVVGAYRAVGVVELVVGLALLTPPVLVVEAWLAVGLSAGMLGYLGYAKVKAPDSSCGCLGEKHAPVGWRSLARSVLMISAGALAVAAVSWWPTAIVDSPVATVGLLVAEAALLVAMSPELDRRWLIPLRRWRVRLRHPLAAGAFAVPLESSVQQLIKSDAYRSVSTRLRSDVLEHWDEGEWRILTYSARTEDGPATAVFAVPRLDYRPADVRVALIPDSEEALV